jgi:hypothetical protein
MRRVIYLLLVTSSLMLLGCAHIEVQQRQKELTARMDALLGKPKEEVVLVLGMPRDTAVIGGLEVLRYYQSYGTRTQAAVAPNPYLVSGSARAWEAYDAINCYFKDGVLVKWDGYVQR